jgi:hypothetical protein
MALCGGCNSVVTNGTDESGRRRVCDRKDYFYVQWTLHG